MVASAVLSSSISAESAPSERTPRRAFATKASQAQAFSIQQSFCTVIGHPKTSQTHAAPPYPKVLVAVKVLVLVRRQVGAHQLAVVAGQEADHDAEAEEIEEGEEDEGIPGGPGVAEVDARHGGEEEDGHAVFLCFCEGRGGGERGWTVKIIRSIGWLVG